MNVVVDSENESSSVNVGYVRKKLMRKGAACLKLMEM